jgi:hypothetical protein
MLRGLHHAVNVPLVVRDVVSVKLVGLLKTDGECWCGVHDHAGSNPAPRMVVSLSPISSPSVLC